MSMKIDRKGEIYDETTINISHYHISLHLCLIDSFLNLQLSHCHVCDWGEEMNHKSAREAGGCGVDLVDDLVSYLHIVAKSGLKGNEVFYVFGCV